MFISKKFRIFCIRKCKIMDTNMQQLMRQEVEKRLRATGRENVEELITFLAESGYYTAHCHNHHHFDGGTSQHSVETLLYALERNNHQVSADNLTIVCLLHDLCDVHGYRHHEGHGRRSVWLITQEAHFPLTNEEHLAILHHMHSIHHPEKFGKDYDQITTSPLWQLLREADHYSAGHMMNQYELAEKIKK